MPKGIDLSDDECQAIRARYELPLSLKALSAEFGYGRPLLTRAIIRAGGTIRPRGRRPKSFEPLLKRRIEEFEALVKAPLDAEVTKTIVDYILGFNDGRTFRKIDRKFEYGGAFSQFRKERMEACYYIMGRLWRAVYRKVSYRKTNIADFGVADEDVQLCIAALDAEDKRAIREWVRSTEYVILPNEAGVHKVVRACEKAMKSIVNSKLRFICQYDPAYDKEDLVSFLREVAYKVALKYDWEMEDGKFAFEKCVNYTKRSLWNAAFLLIKQNTSEDYRRLAKVDTDQRIYQITTISMDSPVDDEWMHIQKTLGEPEDRTIEIHDLVFKMDDANLLKYLRLEVEDVPEFNEFVLKESGLDENELYTKDYGLWRELALRFSGISKRSDRISIKRKVRKELGLWDRQRIRS